MSPHIEEAWRALRLADRDIYAFHVLKNDPDCHLSVVCFHAQQAIEKSIKAVLFSRRIEFKHTHNLTELTFLLRRDGVETAPVPDDRLLRLDPFAVTFRYDDMDIELVEREETAAWVTDIRQWAENQVGTATKTERKA
uniref:HEPN domain-containing protein n=1 Tax=Candidatus Kentrum sp. UNK TaxID=2126344 RepID=A0A451AWG4_9GAMM|nr:MAG: HEPN domain-containing protein [Candidatus Kentron sp. UNK]VFK70383.1 MAG: HEPN domain-containing protein [Candidatus Kentron sp. UNK]